MGRLERIIKNSNRPNPNNIAENKKKPPVYFMMWEILGHLENFFSIFKKMS